MYILVTNDDGIKAPGIQCLAKALADLGRVTVVAPDQERSANSHALTIRKSLYRTEESSTDHRIQRIAFSGTPVDCVKMALEYLYVDDKPDVLVSGINNGYNLGSDVLYSGTVAAAMEGCFHGIPSFAVSMAHYDEERAVQIGVFMRQCIERYAIENSFSGLLNINVPPTGPIDWENVVFAPQGIQKYRNVIGEKEEGHGVTAYWLAGEIEPNEEDSLADVSQIRNGHITMTPLQWIQTDYEELEKLKRK